MFSWFYYYNFIYHRFPRYYFSWTNGSSFSFSTFLMFEVPSVTFYCRESIKCFPGYVIVFVKRWFITIFNANVNVSRALLRLV
jgi:hypothetical protein